MGYMSIRAVVWCLVLVLWLSISVVAVVVFHDAAGIGQRVELLAV